MNKPDSTLSTVKRLNFPLNEAVHQWLTPLLDSYFVADTGIDKAIKKSSRTAGSWYAP